MSPYEDREPRIVTQDIRDLSKKQREMREKHQMVYNAFVKAKTKKVGFDLGVQEEHKKKPTAGHLLKE